MSRMTPEVAREKLGMQEDGMLSRCPDMPNCVCSCFPDDKKHYIKPVKMRPDKTEKARKIIEKLVSDRPGANIEKLEERYIHVTFTSKLFKFVDDVEFLLQPENGLIQIRSASRLGSWDFGANAKRVKQIVGGLESEL